MQANPFEIEEALSGEMASTNDAFDELYIDTYDFRPTPDALVVTLTGSMDGKSHEDSMYAGDKILFTSVLTFERVSGRAAYRRPEFDTGGAVDDEGRYDEED